MRLLTAPGAALSSTIIFPRKPWNIPMTSTAKTVAGVFMNAMERAVNGSMTIGRKDPVFVISAAVSFVGTAASGMSTGNARSVLNRAVNAEL
jgi:hypothetical protein